ncbi:CopG family transcriptional regulator [Streptomyces sp. NPDC002773]|uniref:CopG family transcriptional regulator n=1 Tax=Streptomyces sp. NPDC002773 TaxID=3154430 RepID=UPI00332C8E24
MAMDLHLRDDQTEALRRRAQEEGVSQHALVLRAVDAYLAGTAHEARVRQTSREQAGKWSELLERLG